MRRLQLKTRQLDAIKKRVDRGGDRVDALSLLEHIAALEERMKLDDRSHLQTIDERDRYSDAISEAATDLGCEDEWSNLHDHAKCLVENAAEVAKERDLYKGLLAHPALKELLTRMRDVHPGDLPASLVDLRSAWLKAGRPGHKESWEA